MTVNTWVAGDSASMRTLADGLRSIGTGVEQTATGWHRTRSESEAEWQGPASEAFRDTAKRNGSDADALHNIYGDVQRAVNVFADDLDTVEQRMAQARQVALEGKLMVLDPTIWPPKPPADNKIGGLETDLDTPADERHAAQVYAQQQTAYREAQGIVADARKLERTAHERLVSALTNATKALRQLRQHGGWEKAAASPASPAATDLASAAMAMEEHAAGATKAMFEAAMKGGGPASVHGAWTSMSAAQRADLIDRFPRMVGETDGVPIAARHQANLSRLSAQRQAIRDRLRLERERLDPSHANARDWWRIDQLEQSLASMEKLESKLNGPGEYYLISIDSTAESRGQITIATGNPDKADHVMTYVPGTMSDLGGAMGGLDNLDSMVGRAEELAPKQDVSAVLYADYHSPPFVFPEAATGGYSADAGKELSRFQESLRVTHEGQQPSHNTVLGHSYGSTVVGETARDHGVSADEIAFIGSPGVGVDHASDFRVPPEHVWSGTSKSDVIEYGIDPWDSLLNPTEDHHIHGLDPSDPAFGARDIPTDPSGGHTEYWDKKKSMDSLARITVGKTEGMG